MTNQINWQENVRLTPLTTFKIGGKARYYFQADDDKKLINAVKFAKTENLNIFILGGGSNVLISDQGFDGLVIHIKTRGISVEKSKNGKYLVTARAGEDWDEFVDFCIEKDLAGIECLSGIPGLVGGTPIQNVGAYGQEVSETIKSVIVFDRKFEEVLELSNSDCKFSYRKSIFNSEKKGRFIVLSVKFLFTENGFPKIVYKDLIEKFGETKPSLKLVRKAVCQIRAEKGMLVRQGGFDSQSAGSFFKNPQLSMEEFEEVKNKILKLNSNWQTETIPFFKSEEEKIKIPAAWLIEKAGFQKGYQKGEVGLSTRHTLALTNRGQAKAKDLLELKNEIQNKIFDYFGIHLIPEPNFIGFTETPEN